MLSGSSCRYCSSPDLAANVRSTSFELALACRPRSVALVDDDGALVQVLSYEGAAMVGCRARLSTGARARLGSRHAPRKHSPARFGSTGNSPRITAP